MLFAGPHVERCAILNNSPAQTHAHTHTHTQIHAHIHTQTQVYKHAYLNIKQQGR